jgi:peptide/nickel transport system substrate-binding protein
MGEKRGVSRRTALKLAAIGGTYGLTRAFGLGGPRSAFAQGSDTLVAGWSRDKFERLDPAILQGIEHMQIGNHIYSGLIYADHNLEPQPDLAESWEASKGGREWTFQLRKGVKFHDGEDFTADDVIYNYNRIKDPKTGSIHRRRLDEIDAIEKLDSHVVRFKLKSPSGSFLMTLTAVPGRALIIASRKSLEKMGPEQFSVTPVGTGPFRVAEHQVGTRFVLERFDDYHREVPKLKRVVNIPVVEPETVVAALRTGEIQFHNQPPNQFFEILQRDPNIAMMAGPDPGFRGLMLNQDKVAAFKDMRVRLAIAKAIDRDELAKRAFFGRVLPGVGPIPAAQKLYFREFKRQISAQKYDPEAALRLWEESGVGELKLKTLSAPSYGDLRSAQVLLPLIEKVLPIKFELEQVDPSVGGKRFRTGEYETRVGGSGADIDPNDSIRDFFITKAKFNTFGYGGNITLDTIIEEQFRESDQQRRIALVHLAEDMVMADAPMAFTHHLIEYLAVRKEVKGFRMSPTPTWSLATVSLG